jgi:hypothetical protein
MATKNLLYGNKFEIYMPKTPILASMVTSIDVIGPSIGIVPVPFVELDINVPGEKVSFGKLELTFNVDEYLDSWMEVYNEMNATAGPHSIESLRKEHYQDIVINILNNSSSEVVRQIIFEDCWFNFLGSLALDTGSNENVLTSTTITYQSFRIESSQNDLTGFDKATYTTDITLPNPFN